MPQNLLYIYIYIYIERERERERDIVCVLFILRVCVCVCVCVKPGIRICVPFNILNDVQGKFLLFECLIGLEKNCCLKKQTNKQTKNKKK